MRTLIVLAFLFFVSSSSGQDLITRTLEGLTCQSTNQPNRIAQKIANQKSSSDVSLFSFSSNISGNGDERVELSIDKSQFKVLKDPKLQDLQIEVPVSEAQSFNLKLYRAKVFSDDAKISGPEGHIKDLDQIETFRGIVQGDHGSLVTMTLINEQLHIGISDQDGTYRIYNNEVNQNKYQLGIDRSQQDRETSCGTNETHKLSVQNFDSEGSGEKAAGDIIEVYVECDFQLLLDKGGVNGVENYVSNLFSEVGTLYDNEDINLVVSDIFVWTSSDPYRSLSLNSVTTILDNFGQNTQNNYDGRLASLIIGRVPSHQGAGGIAWVDVLCSNYIPSFFAGPYNVNYGFGRFSLNPVPGYSVDVAIMAHELGHNIASPHTHSCCWGPNNNKAIDACSTNRNCSTGQPSSCGLVQNPTPPSELGTLMSYCSNIDFTKGFGAEPGNLMRNRVNAANCLVTGGGGGNPPDCTHTNKVYSNTTVPDNTEVIASNVILLFNVVNIANLGSVMWQAENEFVVNGELTVPLNSDLTIIAAECN